LLALAGILLSISMSVPLDLDATVAELERANVQGDVTTLERVRSELRAALSARANGDALLQYTLAYADWRLSSLVERHSDAHESFLEEAEDVLEALLKASPDDAEAQALYGTVNGNRITGMWSGMKRGPRAAKAFERARDLAPENPRVALQEGVSRLFRPKMAGGSVEQAEKDLRRALDRFEKEDPGHPWPNWGHAEIYGWLGYALVKKGELAEARALYEKALELEPDYRWVRETLLHELASEDAKRKGSKHEALTQKTIDIDSKVRER
jgi:tetratricopeptide (TPR) repeat protein